MAKRSLGFLLGCFGILSCGGSSVDQLDFSDFESFSKQKLPELGFCVDEGEVIEARIERTGDDYELGLTIATESGQEFGQTLPPRMLSRDEIDQMLATFSRVAVFNGFVDGCEFVGDFCIRTHYTWDDFQSEAEECSRTRLTPESRDAIDDLLEGLRAAVE